MATPPKPDPVQWLFGGGGLLAIGAGLQWLVTKWLQARKDRDALEIDGKKVVIEGQRVEVERDKLQDAAAAAFRDDLMSRLNSVEELVKQYRAEASEWRQQYFAEREAHLKTKTEMGNRITQLEAEVRDLKGEPPAQFPILG